ncbi:MAG TPA: hypothetical protein VIB39_20000 [Candidatus Angelobacter sp.]|jgi:hypothetical protein
MSKEEILKAIQACAKKLGRNPTLRDLRLAGITGTQLYRKLGNLKKSLTAAGLKADGPGFSVDRAELLLDWAATVRKLGKIPTAKVYTREGSFSVTPFFRRFGSWQGVGQAFRKFAVDARIEKQWKDVLKLIGEHEEWRMKPSKVQERRRRAPLLKGRPVYGDPLLLPGMHHAPINEAGVMFAFGVLARQLGFIVKRWQTDFPDCLAVREMAKGQWQDVNVEVEFESRNFLKHGHDPKKCDVIVCWVHNWPECPEWIEVVELRKVVGGMG